MTASYRLRPIRLAQSGTLVLLMLLFIFAQGPDLFYGALSLALLAVYHIYASHKELAKEMEKRLRAYVETGILNLRARRLGLPEAPSAAGMRTAKP